MGPKNQDEGDTMDDSIYTYLEDKQIILWGAGLQGRNLLHTLNKKGLSVSAFIDSKAESVRVDPLISDFTVYEPDQLGEIRKSHDSPVIIVTPVNSQDRIIEICKNAGFAEGTDLIGLEDFKQNSYVVDISGVCNLKCISCPRGIGGTYKPPVGFMSADTFAKVASKIVAEDPHANCIQLYQWGEPLLNKDLPKIISIARKKGLPPSISSNLNSNVDLDAIIKAEPDWFRVSLSGFGSRYEVTHTGGKFPLFYQHLNDLHTYINKYKVNTKVQVFYHLYKDNRGDDLRKAKDFCLSKGFEFQTIWAAIVSLDAMLVYINTGYLSDEARRAADLLEFDLDTTLSKAKADAYKKCQVGNVVCINWDLSVPGCFMYYDQENDKVTNNFLDIPLSDLMVKKKKANTCNACRRHGLHRYCEVFINYPTEY